MRWIAAIVATVATVAVASAADNDQNADLTWDATTYSGTGPVVYEVQRTVGDCALPDENPWNTIGFTQGISATSYVDANLGEGMTFCYRVGAAADENRTGFSDWSNRAEFTVPLVPRPPVTNLNSN